MGVLFTWKDIWEATPFADKATFIHNHTTFRYDRITDIKYLGVRSGGSCVWLCVLSRTPGIERKVVLVSIALFRVWIHSQMDGAFA